ncbi:MAG TPA: twin-arginine translocase TatA/TatE family subunit [Candidatus Poseidoniales archaeon]|nr:twin-arginine translocase TatA/TatE family subunit [Candidatus Poseidoniales archaeon]
MVGGLGTPELLIILFLFFMLFGIERLPKMARSMGQARGEFHKGLKDVTDPPELREGATDSASTEAADEKE